METAKVGIEVDDTALKEAIAEHKESLEELQELSDSVGPLHWIQAHEAAIVAFAGSLAALIANLNGAAGAELALWGGTIGPAAMLVYKVAQAVSGKS